MYSANWPKGLNTAHYVNIPKNEEFIADLIHWLKTTKHLDRMVWRLWQRDEYSWLFESKHYSTIKLIRAYIDGWHARNVLQQMDGNTQNSL